MDEIGIPYIIIGGQAVLLYGDPRMTNDIDVALGVDVDRFQDIFEFAENMGFKCLVDNPKDFVIKTMVIPLVEKSSEIKIDMIFSNSEFEKKAIERANKIEVDGYFISFASLEDIIVFKIFSGRPRDIEDAKNILLKNPVFDREYIVGQLEHFDKSLALNLAEIFQNLLTEIKN
ncbi:nucleotidyltransferase [candidate division WOR-3 bacterium]|nr:nucleotidyltransferase [candidate division WOR-3 bacterium]